MNSHIFVQWCRNRKRSIELLLFCLITLIYTLFSLVGFVCVSSSSCFFYPFQSRYFDYDDDEDYDDSDDEDDDDDENLDDDYISVF